MCKKQKNQVLILLVLCVFTLSIVACNRADNTVKENQSVNTFSGEMDPKELSELVYSQLAFSAELNEVEEDIAKFYFRIEDDTQVNLRMSNAGSELVAAFCLNSSDETALEDNIEAFLQDQRMSFTGYSPKDVQRIDEAIVEVCKKNVVLVISDDASAAKQVIADVFAGKLVTLSENDNSNQDGTQEELKENDSNTALMQNTGETSAKEMTVNETTSKEMETQLPKVEETQSTIVKETQPISVESIIKDGAIKNYKGVMVVGDTGYTFSGYNEELMIGYTNALKGLADALQGVSTVYSVPIPMSGGITFPDNLATEQTYTVQPDILNKMEAMFGDTVKLVNMNDILMEHRSEYLYFRTDHHWTALGAYYGYRAFCAKKGIVPEELDSYETKVFDNFHGTYTFDGNGNVQDQEMYDHPDTVTAYLPHDSSTLHVINRDGSEFDWQVICDVTNYGSAAKYVTFGVGDYPLATVHNENKHDGSACIVVKDSFGNAFVPFLVDHYEYIYGVDYRYGREQLVSFAKEHQVQDILFVVSMQNTCNGYAVGRMQELCR